MISVETRDHNSSGIADLEEAVALAKSQGIANAVGAVDEDTLAQFFSLNDVLGMGFVDDVPGISTIGISLGGITVRPVITPYTPPSLRNVLTATEDRIVTAAGDDLPDWHPTASPHGVRMVTMEQAAHFHEHTDQYEGLVAALQLGILGEKTMRARLHDGEVHEVPIKSGDITFFAGDTFSNRSRTPHAFSFTGLYALAFTLGQDPLYTISGRYPLIENNPQYRHLLHQRERQI